jgi:hypothetical protein
MRQGKKHGPARRGTEAAAASVGKRIPQARGVADGGRQRRIKCDEVRPSCVKCTRAGWTCSYPDPKPVEPKTVKTLLAPISRYAIPFKVPGSQKDRQVLHYYCVQGSGELAGWFNLDFWSRVVSAVVTHHGTILTA